VLIFCYVEPLSFTLSDSSSSNSNRLLDLCEKTEFSYGRQNKGKSFGKLTETPALVFEARFDELFLAVRTDA
jgi:hypothetical protein